MTVVPQPAEPTAPDTTSQTTVDTQPSTVLPPDTSTATTNIVHAINLLVHDDLPPGLPNGFEPLDCAEEDVDVKMTL